MLVSRECYYWLRSNGLPQLYAFYFSVVDSRNHSIWAATSPYNRNGGRKHRENKEYERCCCIFCSRKKVRYERKIGAIRSGVLVYWIDQFINTVVVVVVVFSLSLSLSSLHYLSRFPLGMIKYIPCDNFKFWLHV